jgi:hypothetical protein
MKYSKLLGLSQDRGNYTQLYKVLTSLFKQETCNTFTCESRLCQEPNSDLPGQNPGLSVTCSARWQQRNGNERGDKQGCIIMRSRWVGNLQHSCRLVLGDTVVKAIE